MRNIEKVTNPEAPSNQKELKIETNKLPDMLSLNDLKDTSEMKTLIQEVERKIGTQEGIRECFQRHPEKAELWGEELSSLDQLEDPNASPLEKRSAVAKLSSLKGQLLETSVKDALADLGFDVDEKQKLVDGESGGTKPDIIAVNNTNSPISAFGTAVEPGETLSCECKCGGKDYITNQLKNHIPNQLSGLPGNRVLVVTADIQEVSADLINSVCKEYNTTPVDLNVSVTKVDSILKEMSKS